jgi:hypothetical protein
MTALLGLLQRLLSAEVIGSNPLVSADGSWKCFCSAVNPKEATVCFVCSATREISVNCFVPFRDPTFGQECRACVG